MISYPKKIFEALKITGRRRRNRKMKSAVRLFNEERKYLPELIRKASEEIRFGRRTKSLWLKISLLTRHEDMSYVKKMTGVCIDDNYVFLKRLMIRTLRELNKKLRLKRTNNDILRLFKEDRKGVFRVPLNELTPLELLLIRKNVEDVYERCVLLLDTKPRNIQVELRNSFSFNRWPRFFGVFSNRMKFIFCDGILVRSVLADAALPASILSISDSISIHDFSLHSHRTE